MFSSASEFFSQVSAIVARSVVTVYGTLLVANVLGLNALTFSLA